MTKEEIIRLLAQLYRLQSEGKNVSAAIIKLEWALKNKMEGG